MRVRNRFIGGVPAGEEPPSVSNRRVLETLGRIRAGITSRLAAPPSRNETEEDGPF